MHEKSRISCLSGRSMISKKIELMLQLAFNAPVIEILVCRTITSHAVISNNTN